MARRASGRGSAQFRSIGQGESFITFVLETNQFVHLIDRERKKFLGGDFGRALENANRSAAIEMQKAIAEALDTSIKRHRTRERPRRPDERLKTAILANENREVFANTFRVGIPSWYDRSPAALYWRGVEEKGIGKYTTYGFFTVPGSHGPQQDTSYAQMNLIQIRRGKMRNGRAPVKIKVKKFDAYHFHRVGILNATASLSMGLRYQDALRPLGLELQLHAGALHAVPRFG